MNRKNQRVSEEPANSSRVDQERQNRVQPPPYKRCRNYMDDTCEYIEVPLPGPVRMNQILYQMLQPEPDFPAPELRPYGSHLAYMNTNSTQKSDITPIKEITRKCGGSAEKFDRSSRKKRMLDVRDDASVLEEQFMAQVNFYNDDETICSHNFFLVPENPQQKVSQITRVNNNSIIVKFESPGNKDAAEDQNENSESKVTDLKSKAIILKFFKFFKLFSKKMISFEHLKKNIFSTDFETLGYSKIIDFLLKFFRLEDFSEEIGKLNKYELLFVGVLLHKKKYLFWNNHKVDFARLQTSPSKLSKSRLYETFLTFFFKYLIDLHSDQNTNSGFQKRSERYFYFLFGKDRMPELQNIQTLKAAIKSIRNTMKEMLPDESSPDNLNKAELLRLFTRKFVKQGQFLMVVSVEMLNKITTNIFDDYKENKMEKMIRKIVSCFEKKMSLSENKIKGLLDYCMTLKSNSKFQGVWTFEEFKQGKEIFIEYAGI